MKKSLCRCHHFTHVYKKSSYNACFLRYGVRQTSVILGHVLLFYPTTDPEIKIWTKWKKNPGYIILLHLCTINEDHMMYGSWDVVAQRTEFFVILRHFLPFDPHLTTRKIKILKNENKSLEILSFHTRVPQITIIWCMVPEIWSAKDRIFSHFGLIFALLQPTPPPPTTPNLKKWKKLLRISLFYTSVPRIVIIFYILPEIWRVKDVTVIFYPRTAQIKI